jgi:poly(A) polymerase Pap1
MRKSSSLKLDLYLIKLKIFTTGQRYILGVYSRGEKCVKTVVMKTEISRQDSYNIEA